MLSLYIHIPFCEKKCSYCDFFISPLENNFNTNYLELYTDNIINEINKWWEIYKNEYIRTIFIWWWTPLSIWIDNIFLIVEKIKQKFNIEYLEEINIEINPTPIDWILSSIKMINNYFRNYYRVRLSFWIQSLDDEILKNSYRWYNFNQIVWFLRDLSNIKAHNNIFNFDFIAFWIKEYFWDNHKINFFTNFVKSWLADSFSVYNLELFPWSKDYWKGNINEDFKYNEFSSIKEIILSDSYKRYEISNFALLWKECIHNKIYWNCENYIWIWINSSSFIKEKYLNNFNIFFNLNNNAKYARFSNTNSWNNYFKWDFLDLSKITYLTDQDYLIENFFLKFRTNYWIDKIEIYKEILVNNYELMLLDYQKDWFLMLKNSSYILTDKWMDVYNYIITSLVKKFY